MKNYSVLQQQRRQKLFAAHQKTIDAYWADDGSFNWPPDTTAHGGYRAILWHCLSYLAGDAHCVAKANRIICRAYNPSPCHFSPGAVIDVLQHHRAHLTPEAIASLERYLRLNLPYLSTEDLKIHGYNDNHPFKAMHALIVGGEMLEEPGYVQLGLEKLRGALEVYQRNGFPCEYNSPNYTVVSLNPLANIVEQARNEEAKALALRLEHFFWQDLALHFDPRAGLPAGPFSRGYVNDYSGLLSGTLALLALLWPEHFDFDLIKEAYDLGATTSLLAPAIRAVLPFYQSHPVWFASATYHPTEEIEQAIFSKPAGAYVRGTAESGVATMGWANPQEKPAGAPQHHPCGPRRSLLTTYFGPDYSLGTAQYSWLDNVQAANFHITVNRGPRRHPDAAAVYYSRMFFDDHCPYSEIPVVSSLFREQGETRILQHRNTALVCYNPIPYYGRFKRLRTGIFRPIMFSQPQEIYAGDTHVNQLNLITDRMVPIAINEGSVYIGLLPLCHLKHEMARNVHLHIHTYSEHLAIQMYSFEGWSPQDFTYEQILETHAGFICEVHSASDFASFTAFRKWLAAGCVSDAYYARMRTVTYQRPGLKLSACYSPYQSMFRYCSINNVAQPVPTFQLDGLPDPGYGLTLPESALNSPAEKKGT